MVRDNWYGLKDLREKLAKLPTDLAREAAVLATNQAGDTIEEMRAAYRRRTGKLAAGVRITRMRKRGNYGVSVRITNRVAYAAYVEYGTKHMPPQRVFIPAMQRGRRQLQADIAAHLFPKYNLRAKGSAVE